MILSGVDVKVVAQNLTEMKVGEKRELGTTDSSQNRLRDDAEILIHSLL